MRQLQLAYKKSSPSTAPRQGLKKRAANIVKYTATLALATLFAHQVLAIDIVKVPLPQGDLANKPDYKHEVIKRALEITTPAYGPFEFHVVDISMVRARALVTLKKGDTINLYMSLANEEWNRETIPIKIPIRLGLLSYRLLLVNKQDLKKFEQVNTVEDLKKLSVGLQNDWLMTKFFTQREFNVVKSSNFNGIFSMLEYRRFDYIPRGIHEIYPELEARSDKLKDIIVEPRLALFIRSAGYAYVSPKHPRIATRIEAGLREMIATGELEAMLKQYYAEDIRKADLGNRTIIEIENPLFVDQEILNDASLWYSPFEKH